MRDAIGKVGWLVWLLALVIGACQPKGDDGYPSAQALTAALRQAGASVEAGEGTPPAVLDAERAEVLQVDGEVVYVYAYASTADAERMASAIAPDGRSIGGVPLAGNEHVMAWSSARVVVVYPGTDGGLILLLGGLLGDPLTLPTDSPQEPYPPAVTAALLAWAGSLGIEPTSVEVVGYNTAEWPDACLGLPAPGETCAAVAVAGWVVELRSGQHSAAAHTDELGLQVRLAPGG
ncbi:MAG: hypothetical protein MUO35_09735 [Anaerolineales bacterium]|nr:hypothetical protein [Anaerolineales bacterium]